MNHRIAAILLALAGATAAAQDWPAASQTLLKQAQAQPGFAQVEALHPSYRSTSDGRSFVLVWTPNAATPPAKWIVSLPGTGGYATRDLAVWHPHLQGRDVGLVVVQWWLGSGDTTRDYYNPFDIYREIDRLLADLKVPPNSALLHGFSRGAANLYAVAALDRARGRQYFSTFVASSGSASLDYPPTQLVMRGEFGAAPYAGTQWVTACGDRDANPGRDGCPGMRRTAEWIKERGGSIALVIEDKTQGHGALQLNPANAKQLLDWYLRP
ncbi:MAG: hypothetical protein HYX43_20625 [Burkholderiales bacterium]|nr:hypothetical protein [Burkholderiales bacterium]